MADKNTPTNQETTPETQVESIADKTRKGKFEQIANTVVLLTGLTLSVNSAQAGDLPKGYEKDVQAGKKLSMQDTTKKPELADKIVLVDASAEKEMFDEFIKVFGQEDGDKLINQYNSLSNENKSIIIDYFNNLGKRPLKCVLLRTGILYNTKIAEDTISKWTSGNRDGFEDWPMIDKSPAILYKFLTRIDKSYSEIDDKGDYYKTISNTTEQIYIEQLKILQEQLDKHTKEYNELKAKEAELTAKEAELTAKEAELTAKLQKINDNIKFLSAIVGTQK